MIIKEFEDVRKLLNERVEAMEDLNWQELHDCVDAFITLSGLITKLGMINALHSVAPCEEDRRAFEEGKSAAEQALEVIDDLTLRTDAAE